MELTGNQARLRDALPGTAEPGATPAELAEATGLAYSTVTRMLRELRDLGVAARDDDAGTWHTTTSDDTTAQAATANQVAAAVPDVDDRAAAPDPETDVPEPDPADDGQDAAATDEQAAHTQAATEDPEDPADRKPDHETPSPDAPADTEPQQQAATGKTRLGKGELRDMVLAVLGKAGAPLGPTELSRLLDGRSQGAITNACEKLAGAGLIVATSERPRRWAATGTPAAVETVA